MEFGTGSTDSRGTRTCESPTSSAIPATTYCFADFNGTTGVLELSNQRLRFVREFQVAARIKAGQHLLNTRMSGPAHYGDLNDLNQFFGNLAQPVIQPDARGRLPFDAPNRFLFWGTIAAPWGLTVVPVYDLHTGFPYSIQNEYRAYRRAPQRRSVSDLLILRYPGITTDFVDLSRETHPCPSGSGGLQSVQPF